jgi:hypothetical protein
VHIEGEHRAMLGSKCRKIKGLWRTTQLAHILQLTSCLYTLSFCEEILKLNEVAVKYFVALALVV